MKKPLFSIIVPAHNGETYIRKCLDSIKSQTIRDYELIVVCDACTDKTEEIAKEYTDKVLTVNYERDGMTRNAGLDAAIGKWVMFLDDDDWWTDNKVLTKVKATLNEDIDIAFLPFNLPYTMDKVMFEDLANSIKAKYLYPYHTMGTAQKSIESINVPDSIVRIRKFEK